MSSHFTSGFFPSVTFDSPVPGWEALLNICPFRLLCIGGRMWHWTWTLQQSVFLCIIGKAWDTVSVSRRFQHMAFPLSDNQALRKRSVTFSELETHNCIKPLQIPQYVYTLNVSHIFLGRLGFCRREWRISISCSPSDPLLLEFNSRCVCSFWSVAEWTASGRITSLNYGKHFRSLESLSFCLFYFGFIAL